MVRRQVHLCLPDLDATQFMPGLVDVLIPGCPLMWLDDTTGKADETYAILQRICNPPKRLESGASLSMVTSRETSEGPSQGHGEDKECGREQRTFIFSADYRPPTSVRTPARHKASLSQDELAEHAFGPPAKGYDFADRVSAPYYAKPFYEAVSCSDSSESNRPPLLSTPSLSGGSGSSSSSSSPDLPLSPASTYAYRASHGIRYISSEAESYFPPQPSPQLKDLPTTSSASPSFPPPSSTFYPPSRSNSPLCRITPDPAVVSSAPRRLDRVLLDHLGKERVTVANHKETPVPVLPGPSTPLRARSLRTSSPMRSSFERDRQNNHSLKRCASSPLLTANNMQQNQRAAMARTQTTTMDLPHMASGVTLECDNPISASVSGRADPKSTSSPPPSSCSDRNHSSSSQGPASLSAMTTTAVARTSQAGLTAGAKRYVPPPKGTFRTSYVRALRSEMASAGDISLLQQVADLPSEVSNLSSGPSSGAAHPEITLSLRPARPPRTISSREVVRRTRHNGNELVRIDEQTMTNHTVVLSISEFDLFGARQSLSATEWAASKPWMRSPAAPPPPKIRRWLRRVRQGQRPDGDDRPTAQVTEITDDVFEPPSVPRSRCESGRSAPVVEPVKIQNVTRGGTMQNTDQFIEMRRNAADVTNNPTPSAGIALHEGSDKEDECIPL